MTLSLNGVQIESNTTTVTELLEQESIETKGIAIAVNRRVVPRSVWSERELNEGDEIVVVSAVFGG